MWVILKEYPNYAVSTEGEVKSLARKVITLKGTRAYGEKLLKPLINKNNGYCYVSIKNVVGSYKHKLVHKLVAHAFIPNPFNKIEVNHKNGIKTDNRVKNLEWVSREENIQHAYNTGLIDKHKKSLLCSSRERNKKGQWI